VTFLFYLAKLKILELHSKSGEKLTEILADGSFPQSTKQ
jgi:hypothetical protein